MISPTWMYQQLTITMKQSQKKKLANAYYKERRKEQRAYKSKS